MRKYLFIAALLFVASNSAKVNAEPIRIGFGMDIGVPSGIALGVVVHPKVDWLNAQVSLTHNLLNFGARGSFKLDPLAAFNFPIGIIADFQTGFNGFGRIPFKSDLPELKYYYHNFYAGLRLGRSANFNWLIEVGPSFISLESKDFESFARKNVNGNFTTNDPKGSAWVTPTFSTGFNVVW